LRGDVFVFIAAIVQRMTANRRRHDFTLLPEMKKAARNRISGFRRPFGGYFKMQTAAV